jgi:hypothetical protein
MHGRVGTIGGTVGRGTIVGMGAARVGTIGGNVGSTGGNVGNKGGNVGKNGGNVGSRGGSVGNGRVGRPICWVGVGPG